MKKFQNLLLCYPILKKCIYMYVFTGNDALRCGGGKLHWRGDWFIFYFSYVSVSAFYNAHVLLFIYCIIF